MPLPNRPLQDAFARGAIVVTPNRRLARRLVALHDDTQRASGLTVWPAAVALPWDAWLVTLWQDVLAAGVEPGPTRLQTPIQSTHSWSGIVAAHASPLIDRRGAAGLAAGAWTLVHAWGAGGQSWRGWAPSDDGDDDPGSFARWADAYAGTLARSDAVDAAQLPDWLAGRASRIGAWRDAPVVLAGFLELAPQQERLLAALAAAGTRIERVATLPDAPGQAWRVRGATPRDEVARALGWARARALADPAATIGIAIEDLALRREEVRVLADDILCPALQWPGRESAARPYNMSLGVSLAEVPLVAVALDLIAIAGAALPAGRASALLRSPYLPMAPETLAARSGLEAEWLRLGRREIAFSEAIVALGIADRALAQRWRTARDTCKLPARASPRGWAEAWRTWLHAFDWPGDRVLTSGEYQARGAWDEVLAQFATLDAVETRLSSGDALSTLRAHLAAVVFQPEAPRAPIQILGILEAAGLPFDALWVGGLGPERWPPAPQPNPLLPLAWQRSRNVPRATAARELAYARTLIAQFARAAPDVVFSHAGDAEDRRSTPSILVPAGVDFGPGEPALPRSTAQVQFVTAPKRESLPDIRAPALPAGGPVRGGAGLIEAQSDCPFKAVASHRLAAEPWSAPIDGLSAMERGTLVHAAMAAFWREVGSQAAFAALDPESLGVRIAAAARAATKAVGPERWRVLSPLVEAGEVARLAGLLAVWLNVHERGRPPFAVANVEAALPLDLRGLRLQLRLDRIDALGDGGTAIIDYKTGRAMAPGTWFERRPQAPQLGLYLLARRAAAPDERIRAIVYAQLKPGETRTQGLAADDGAWPKLGSAAGLKHAGLADWAAVEAHFEEALGALAAEIVAGDAAVTPRDAPATCRNCGIQPLCRIGAIATDDDSEDGNE